MGTQYYIICKDCNVVRNLDKSYGLYSVVNNGDESVEMAKEIQGDFRIAFRAGLLVSFVREHQNHNCFFCDEHYEDDDGDLFRLNENDALGFGGPPRFEYENRDLWVISEKEIAPEKFSKEKHFKKLDEIFKRVEARRK